MNLNLIKIFGILFTAMLCASNIRSQELNLHSIMTDRSLYPERLSQMQWAKNSPIFYHVKGRALMAVNTRGRSATATSLDNLNTAFTSAGFDDLRRFPFVEVINEKELIFWQDTTLFLFDFSKNNIRVLNHVLTDAEHIYIDYNHFHVAFTLGNNLYVSIDKNIHQITDEPNTGIVYGQSVHREEFGIEKGIFWSPNGRYFAFYRMDETMVTDYPLVNIGDPIAELRNIKYPMAGGQNHKVTVGVFDLAQMKYHYLETEHWDDQYLTNISWAPDEKNIYIAVLHRNQREMKFCQYETGTGAFKKTIFEETASCYVEPLSPAFFMGDNVESFIWQSQKSGFNHLYMYSVRDNSVRQLTDGPWPVREIAGYVPHSHSLIITASKASPLQTEVYNLNLNSLELTKVSKEAGSNNVMLSHNGRFAVITLSSISEANKVSLTGTNGNELAVLHVSSNACNENLGLVDIFTLKADDGITDLYCRLIKPSNFDVTKKYPVIVYVYGGPHAQMISDTWTGGAGLFLHYLAQQGYLVFTLDNRGSANRGRAFEQAIYKNLGTIEVDDQMTGVAHLKTLSFVDTARIGVHGWSYGGYMTIMMMVKNPGVFKAGVAGGPVTDWKYYEIMYGERYMSSPQENPDGYQSASVLNKIEHLKDRLLVIHGDNDPVVVWQHSLELLRKAVEKDVLIDYAVYPGHEHNIIGVNRAHLMNRITTYFNDFLK